MSYLCIGWRDVYRLGIDDGFIVGDDEGNESSARSFQDLTDAGRRMTDDAGNLEQIAKEIESRTLASSSSAYTPDLGESGIPVWEIGVPVSDH